MESPPEGDDGGDDDENGYPPLVLSEQEIDRLLDMIIPQSVMDRHNPFLPEMNEEAAQRQIAHLATTFPLMPESHRRTISGRMFDRGRPLSRDTVRAWLVDFFDEDRMMAIIDDELHAVLSTLIQAFRMQQRAQNIAGLVNEDQTQEVVETQPDQLTANHQKISEDHTQKCSENHRDETAMDSQRISEDSTQEGGESQSNGTANTVGTSTRKKGKSFSESSIPVQAAKQNLDAVFAGIDDSENDLLFFPAETSTLDSEGNLNNILSPNSLLNQESEDPEDFIFLDDSNIEEILERSSAISVAQDGLSHASQSVCDCEFNAPPDIELEKDRPAMTIQEPPSANFQERPAQSGNAYVPILPRNPQNEKAEADLPNSPTSKSTKRTKLKYGEGRKKHDCQICGQRKAIVNKKSGAEIRGRHGCPNEIDDGGSVRVKHHILRDSLDSPDPTYSTVPYHKVKVYKDLQKECGVSEGHDIEDEIDRELAENVTDVMYGNEPNSSGNSDEGSIDSKPERKRRKIDETESQHDLERKDNDKDDDHDDADERNTDESDFIGIEKYAV
jgi:hypothetical protein